MFRNSDEVIIREFKIYFEESERLNIKNNIQLLRTTFLEKCGSLDQYDESLEKQFIIYHKQLQFDKNAGWTLIGICDKFDGTFSDHETFCILDYLFDRIKSPHQDKNIMCRFISNEPNGKYFLSEATEIYDKNIQKKKTTIGKKLPEQLRTTFLEKCGSLDQYDA